MAFELPEIKTNVDKYVQDDANFITSTEKDSFIQDALRELNKDKPNVVPKDIAADGSQDYLLPSEYIKGFSIVETVESPAGENPPQFRVREDDWFIYEDPTQTAGEELRLRFKLTGPNTGTVIRTVISTPHVVTTSASTLNQNDFLAVVFKATSLAYAAIAAHFAEGTENTLTIEITNMANRSQNYNFLSERFKTLYNKMVGIGEKVAAAHAMAEADIIFAHGEDFVWHPRLTR